MKKYKLRRPIFGKMGRVIAERARLDKRNGTITIDMPNRTNLPAAIAKQFEWMKINDSDSFEKDMRIPIIKELRERFRNMGLGFLHVVQQRFLRL